MLRPYLKIWDWDCIFGRAVKAISSLGVRSPCPNKWTLLTDFDLEELAFALSKSRFTIHPWLLEYPKLKAGQANHERN